MIKKINFQNKIKYKNNTRIIIEYKSRDYSVAKDTSFSCRIQS